MKTFEQIKLNDEELGLLKFLVEGPNTCSRTVKGHKFRNELRCLCDLELIRYVDENVYIRTERGIDYLHYHRETPKKSTPLTMTIDGKVYEDGKLYMTKDGFVGWFRCSLNGNDQPRIRLESLDPHQPPMFCQFGFVVEIKPEDLGTITDAPIELIDGEWYMCEWDEGHKSVMFYNGVNLLDSSDGKPTKTRNPDYIKILYRMGKV